MMTATLDDVAKKRPELSAEQLAATELVRLAKEQGLSLTGPDGLLKLLVKSVIETALAEEMTDHLGYEKHDPAGVGSENIRNGTRSKTVISDNTGPVGIDVPRDRAGTFEPQITPPAADRRDDVVLGQPFAVANAEILNAAVRTMDQPVEDLTGPGAIEDGHLQGVDGQVGAQAGRDLPANDHAGVNVDDERCVHPADMGPEGARRKDQPLSRDVGLGRATFRIVMDIADPVTASVLRPQGVNLVEVTDLRSGLFGEGQVVVAERVL
jgi:mutator family transposase